MLGIMIPIDTIIFFQRGRYTTNQILVNYNNWVTPFENLDFLSWDVDGMTLRWVAFQDVPGSFLIHG